MTLAQLKDIYARNDLTADELRVVVDRLNQLTCSPLISTPRC